MTDYQEHLFPAPACVVAFSSTARFEWGRTLAGLNLPHVLMRDSTERWYADGVPGLGDNAAVCRYLEGLTYVKVATLGLSAGAYAALRYGLLGKVDAVIAISPVTGAGPSVIAEFPSWAHRLQHDHDRFVIDDLKQLYFNSIQKPRVHAYFSDGPGTELDYGMAARLDLEEITFIPGYSHDQLGRGVRDTGALAAVLNKL